MFCISVNEWHWPAVSFTAHIHTEARDARGRAVTVLDFSLPRWSSNKYRGLAVNRTTPPQLKKYWRGRTFASLRLHAAEPQHIVAGVRFH